MESTGGLYQGHFDDAYNKASEIGKRNDNVDVISGYDENARSYCT